MNSVIESELESAARIGTARPTEFIVNRPYGYVDELERLNGIGSKQVERGRLFLTSDWWTEKQ